MNKLEDINFEFVGKGGKIKMISWGKDYKSWDNERKVEYLEALASSLNDACDRMQQERNKLLTKVLELKSIAEVGDRAFQTQKNININAITGFNAEKQQLIKRIRELEKENSLLKVGSSINLN